MRNAMIVVLAAILIAHAFSDGLLGQDFRRYEPKTLPDAPFAPSLPTQPTIPVEGSDEVLVERLDAVLILNDSTKIDPQAAYENLEGLQFNYEDGGAFVHSPGFRAIVEGYLGGPITLRRLNQMSRDLILYYRRMGRPVVDVIIPEQKISGGTVQIVVLESRIGRVLVEGGCFFDPCMLADEVCCTRQGDFVRENALRSDLEWLNRNPFRRVEVDLRPGQNEGETDVVFQVRDVRPWKSYFGYENTGVPALGLNRLYAGVIWGNAFGRDGQLSYQYTADAEFEHLSAHSAVYQRAWNPCWSWQTYGALSDFEAITDPIAQTGQSWQVGGAVLRTFRRNYDLQSWLTFGADFKSTNNDLEFGGTDVGTGIAQLFELNVGYDRIRRFDNINYWLLANDFYYHPWTGFGAFNNAADFNTIRVDTRPGYCYNRAVAESVVALPLCTQLLGRMTGQAASQRLLWTEMLGYGGYDSIRGYDQRAYNADAGWFANFEYGPQPINFGSGRRRSTLRPFVFFDVGQGWVRDPQPGEVSDLYLSSTGIGLRYNWSDRLVLRFDYSHGFQEIPGSPTNERVHLGLTYVLGPQRP